MAVERVCQHCERLGYCAFMLVVQAAGERHRADEPVPEPVGVRAGCGQVIARCASLATMEADHGGDAEIAAGCPGFLQVLRQDLHLGQRLVPSSRLEEQLAEGA